jgi:hypothetical protein
MVLGDVDHKNLMVPTWSQGKMRWTIPDVPEGWYRVKYVSGWSAWREGAEFIAISPKFMIKNESPKLQPSAASLTHAGTQAPKDK